MKQRTVLWAAATLAVAGAFGRAARADEPSAEEQAALARTFEKQGAAAASKGDASACVEAYTKALGLAPEATMFGRRALCEEALARYVEAYDDIHRAKEREPPPAQGGGHGVWAVFNDALERLKWRVTRVIVIVDPTDAEVFLDGRSLGDHLSGRWITVLPGDHTWKARLDGREVTFSHTARAGDLPDVPLRFDSPAAAPPPRPPPAPARVIIVEPPPEPPCAAAGGERMSPKVCDLFEIIYNRRVNPIIGVAVGGLVSAGFTADAGPGLFGLVDFRWWDKDDVGFVLSAEVRGLLPTKGGLRSDGKPLDVSLITLGVAPCVRYKWALGCAVVDAGITIASQPPGFSFNSGSDAVLANVGIGPRIGLDLPIVSRFGIRAFADMRFSPVRDTGYDDFGLDGKTHHIEWENPVLSGLFGLGVSFK